RRALGAFAALHRARPERARALDREPLGAVEGERALVLAVHAQLDRSGALRLEPRHAPAQQRAPEPDAARPGHRAEQRDLALPAAQRVAEEAHAAAVAVGEHQPGGPEVREARDRARVLDLGGNEMP